MSRLIAHAALVARPWKNGGGSTTEIAVGPDGAGFDDFDWRISLATIGQSGPFSLFPGIDRTLTLVSGAAVTLDFGAGHCQQLDAGNPSIVFAGEQAVHAITGPGSTTDFNVMTRRATCSHRLERREVSGHSELSTDATTLLLFLAAGGELTVNADDACFRLGPMDALLLDANRVWTLGSAQATVLVVEINQKQEI